MRAIYHLTPPEVWTSAPEGPFSASSLASEGFIHCSYRDQAVQIANMFYVEAPSLIALEVNLARLSAKVVDEDSGSGELFPHVYGPIDRAAITATIPLVRDKAGNWRWPTN